MKCTACFKLNVRRHRLPILIYRITYCPLGQPPKLSSTQMKNDKKTSNAKGVPEHYWPKQPNETMLMQF